MTDFEVNVVTVDRIDPIEGADRIEVATIGGYQTIVSKGTYAAGDLAVYLPEDALLPPQLLRVMGLWDETKGKGKLSGAAGNRIKAIKMRGVLSQGILHPITGIPALSQKEGTDVAEWLGITKADEKIPSTMMGDTIYLPEMTASYDVQPLQKNMRKLADGEDVVMTEKLHGTLMGICFNPNVQHEQLPDGNIGVFSKGLGKKGFVFEDKPADNSNLYMKMFHKYREQLTTLLHGASLGRGWATVYVFGEVIGKGVQDLGYDSDEKELRIFDVAWKKENGELEYASSSLVQYIAQEAGISAVPIIFKGKYSEKDAHNNRMGRSTLAGHIREGVVIRPVAERHDRRGNRVGYKYVNPDYLTRKNGTEYA